MIRKECVRISEGICKKCSACDVCELYKQPKEESKLPFGFGIWGGQIRDLLPHSTRYYLNGRR